MKKRKQRRRARNKPSLEDIYRGETSILEVTKGMFKYALEKACVETITRDPIT